MASAPAPPRCWPSAPTCRPPLPALPPGRARHQAWAARWPALSLVGNIGWSAAQTGDLFKNSSLVGNLGATLNWQWLDFGQRKAEEGAARAGYEAAVAAAEQASSWRCKTPRPASIPCVMSSSKPRFKPPPLKPAPRPRAGLKRYEAGVSDFFNLLDAERERLAAQGPLDPAAGAAGGGGGGGGARVRWGMAGVSSPEAQVLGRVARARAE